MGGETIAWFKLNSEIGKMHRYSQKVFLMKYPPNQQLKRVVSKCSIWWYSLYPLLKRITYARKQKKMTQNDLGKAVGTSGDIIGKYERDEIKPSIDTAAKIAEALNVTIDYLVKDAKYQNIDDETLKRMKNIEKLSPEDKSHVYAMLDAFFAKSKLQSLLL